ncbi:DCC1-like thiol-disulfide oxidoreductase family protein [Paludisphaera sp.]|uniref:DCC1-like thiol-disulfide oxidoreductase family protein n=1 Tax=Paludisphaera sp. TaxID=2017432 RepID=UPI00301BBC3D
MRRFLIDAVDYIRSLVLGFARGWSRFFFLPADPTPLGLIRAAVGLLGFWSMFVIGLDLHAYLGSQGWTDATGAYNAMPPYGWSLWFYVPDSLLRVAWLAALGVFASMTVGLFSRTTSVMAWIIIVSTVRRIPIALFGFDQILSTLALYVAVSGAAGQAVSLDRFLTRWREARRNAAMVRPKGARVVSPTTPGRPEPTVSANIGLRLIQLHLAFIYGMAGLAKLQGPSWWTGMALWGTMTAGEFAAFNFTWLAAWPMILNALTHGSLALEIAYPVLVWSRATRPLMIAGAVLLHLGIAVVSPGLTEFGLAMIAANLAFASGGWLRTLAAGREDEQPAIRVLFDGACPKCRASMAAATAADPDRVVEPIDLTAVDVTTIHPSLTHENCMKAMHVVSRSGGVTAGYDAVMRLGARLPLFRPLAIVGMLPGVAHVGRIVYDRIASSRLRDAACTDDVCGLHPPASTGVTASPDRDPAAAEGRSSRR